MNPAARRAGGIGLDEPIAHMSFADFCPPETVEKNLREMAPAACERGVGIGETFLWDAERRETPCSHILIAHRDRRGKLQHFSAIMRDISAEKAAEKRLVEIARLDPLTGLLNRAGFEHALNAMAARRGDGHMALMYVDLDRFKQVNDRHGHATGDEVLRQFAERLRGLVRPTDAVARLGGDEFALVLAGLREPANARMVAEKILAAAHAPFRIGKVDLRIGASIGIATWTAEVGDWRALLERADLMLYRAKEAGRGRYADALNTTFH
jgi:diguanylate cyclase (GGDEF)-like protein